MEEAEQLAEDLRESQIDDDVSHADSALPADGAPAASASKKKRSRKKKSAAKATQTSTEVTVAPIKSLSDLSNVLISRSKHLKYISSYHGNWLTLPTGLIDSLLEYNDEPRADYRRLASEERRLIHAVLAEMGTEKSAPTARAAAKAPSRVENSKLRDLIAGPTPGDYAESVGLKMPPAVDRAGLRNVIEVRRLIEAATDLLTRASSGLTAAELKALNDPYERGGPPLSGGTGTGRNSGISPVLQARLRGMAIASLAQAFRIDEIATSVILMQVATPFEDAAMRVLKTEPSNLDARYVMYFQERIPSRTLCMSTPPDILDRLVLGYHLDNPHLPAMYRSRGVLHLYRQDFAAAVRDFEEGLRICKLQVARKAAPRHAPRARGSGKKGGKRSNGMEEHAAEDVNGVSEHFDVGNAPGDDIGRQLLFSRGMTYFLWATNVIEVATLQLEGLNVPPNGLSNEGGEISLEAAGLEGKLGEDGLYDRTRPAEIIERYRQTFAVGSAVRQEVEELLRLSLRDHEQFQSYFPVFEIPPGHIPVDPKQDLADIAHAARATGIDRSISFRGRRLVHARALTGRIHISPPRPDGLNADPRLHGSYHPMLGETIFTSILAHLFLGEFHEVMRLHYRATRMMAGFDTVLIEKPFFLLGRSLSQSEYHEIFERLSHSWLRHRAPPVGPPEQWQHSGPLSALAHLASFFTTAHEQQLFEIYLSQERESTRLREQANEAHPEASKLLQMFDNRPSSSQASKPCPPDQSHAYGAQTSARAEIAVAWLMAAQIAPLEDQERAELALTPHVGGSSSSKGKGKGKA